MRNCGTCIAIVLAATSAHASEPAKEARQRWLRGNIAEARELYTALAKDPGQRAAAAIGMSQCWQSEGEYDKALSAIDDALKAESKSSNLLARRSELLYLRGRWDDAL